VRAVRGVFDPAPGATPLTPEELRDLIPADIALRADLNEAEESNILRAQDWALNRRRDLLSEEFLLRLHREMFRDVWRWAGKYRTSARNIGIDHWLIPAMVRQLLDDARAWIEFQSYTPDEIAVRLHHRLVFIHPFPNGNGRHGRLMADLLAMRLGRRRFGWGRRRLRDAGTARAEYIAALQSADRHDVAPLLRFARG